MVGRHCGELMVRLGYHTNKFSKATSGISWTDECSDELELQRFN